MFYMLVQHVSTEVVDSYLNNRQMYLFIFDAV